MKALVKRDATPGISFVDLPVPDISENDVLVKIKKTAICGTDLHIYEWDKWARSNMKLPLNIGHEFSGTIVETGSAVSVYKTGDRVSGEGHIVCGHCRNCRAGTRHLCINTKGIGVSLPGAFAEYLRIPAANIFPIPDDISDEQAAIFDPLGNAVHTALSFDLVGEDVLVTGAGPIGIMGAIIAKHVGARKVVITDINDYRLELAKKLGVEYCFNVKEFDVSSLVNKTGMLEGFDVGLEMSGNAQAFEGMLSIMKPGGKIALLGLLPGGAGVNWDNVIFKGLTLKGIYGREMFETWYKMTAMLQSGLNVDAIITHRFSVKDYQEAFEIMQKGQSGKVILNWEGVS